MDNDEVCFKCGGNLESTPFKIVHEEGTIPQPPEDTDPPDRWFKGLVVCKCGGQNIVLRVT